MLRKHIKDRDNAHKCVLRLKEKFENLIKTRDVARQNISLEITKFQDIVSCVSKNLLEGTKRKTWNVSKMLTSSCSRRRDVVNAAWDKVQSNLYELRNI